MLKYIIKVREIFSDESDEEDFYKEDYINEWIKNLSKE